MESTTDEATLAELGKRLARTRIDLGLTQAILARQAGLSKRTVERIEDGASSQISSIVRILRVLGLMDRLNTLVPDIRPRPMSLLRSQGSVRQRASSKHAYETGRESSAVKAWSWGDEEP